jgi:hypothetical protein
MEKTTSLKDLRKTPQPVHISVILHSLFLVLETKRENKYPVSYYPKGRS